MRKQLKPAPKENDIRIKCDKFLLLPKVVAGEIRWLERASWEEQYSCWTLDGEPHWSWEGVRWL